MNKRDKVGAESVSYVTGYIHFQIGTKVVAYGSYVAQVLTQYRYGHHFAVSMQHNLCPILIRSNFARTIRVRFGSGSVPMFRHFNSGSIRHNRIRQEVKKGK